MPWTEHGFSFLRYSSMFALNEIYGKDFIRYE